MASSDLEQVMAANGLSAGQPGGAGPGSAEQAQAQKEQQEYVYITRYIYMRVCVSDEGRGRGMCNTSTMGHQWCRVCEPSHVQVATWRGAVPICIVLLIDMQ